MFLSVIIPAYNEGKRIRKTLQETQGYLLEQTFDWEIIVVNDGSEDGTVQEVLSLSSSHINLVNETVNRGKGYAVRKGLSQARGDTMLYMDADNSTSIREIEQLLPFLKDYDVVIGSRNMPGSRIVRPQSWYRRVLGRLYRWLAHFLVGLRDFNDTQCGFKLFKREVLGAILTQCQINGWSFDAEMLSLALKHGYKIKEVPVVWVNNHHSSMRFKSMVMAIVDLVKLLLRK